MSSLLSTYRTARDLHAAIYAVTQDVTQRIPTQGTPKNIADSVLLARKSADLLADCSKMLTTLQQTLSKAGCMFLVAKGDGEPLQGHFCSASGRSTKAVAIPSRTADPAGYAELCRIMGAPDHPFTRLHFPAIKQAISEHLAKGLELPAELAKYKQYDDFNLVATERSSSTLDAAATQSPYIIKDGVR